MSVTLTKDVCQACLEHLYFSLYISMLRQVPYFNMFSLIIEDIQCLEIQIDSKFDRLPQVR